MDELDEQVAFAFIHLEWLIDSEDFELLLFSLILRFNNLNNNTNNTVHLQQAQSSTVNLVQTASPISGLLKETVQGIAPARPPSEFQKGRKVLDYIS